MAFESNIWLIFCTDNSVWPLNKPTNRLHNSFEIEQLWVRFIKLTVVFNIHGQDKVSQIHVLYVTTSFR